MNTIKTVLAMLFVLFLSSVSFAQTNSVETGIAPDVVTSAQVAVDLASNDDLVNFRRSGTLPEDDGVDPPRPNCPFRYRGACHDTPKVED